MRRLLVALLMVVAPVSAQAWTRAHGGPDNSGFVDVATSAVTAFSVKLMVPDLGPFAPGAGPVVSANGVAYLGASDGRLIAVAKSGQVLWTRRLAGDRKILATPLIGSDGSIYVAGFLPPQPNDHRPVHGWLYRFDPAGTLLWLRGLPVQLSDSGVPLALNAIGSGPSEVVLVAAWERRISTFRVDLVGFSIQGDVLFKQDVGGSPSQAVEGEGWPHGFSLCLPFCPDGGADVGPPPAPPTDRRVPDNAHGPRVGVSIAAGDVIVVTDGYQGVRGYRYAPGVGITRLFEKIDRRVLSSAAAVWPNQRSVYGVTDGRIAFSGPTDEKVADINDYLGVSFEGSPTRLADGRRFVAVDRYGGVNVIDNVVPVFHAELAEETIASASASQNLFYVSTATELVTFDAT